MTERQHFEVLQRLEHFEVRRYESCVVAEIDMSDDYGSATQGAFQHLFSYISRGNKTSASIAMTAPVIAANQHTSDSQNWRISFVMPRGSSIKDLPNPNDSQVHLRELPAQDCVAMSFKGRATKPISEKKEAELRGYSQKENLVLSSETRICRFDPPFKPGFLQYNEIVIPIADRSDRAS